MDPPGGTKRHWCGRGVPVPRDRRGAARDTGTQPTAPVTSLWETSRRPSPGGTDSWTEGISRVGRDPGGSSSPAPGTTQEYPKIQTLCLSEQAKRFLNSDRLGVVTKETKSMPASSLPLVRKL